MRKLLLAAFALLIMASGASAATVVGTATVDSLAYWSGLRVTFDTTSLGTDSVIAQLKLWGSTNSSFTGDFTLWGTISSPTIPDTLDFTGMTAFDTVWMRWEITSYDTATATRGSHTTYTAVASGQTKHHAMPRVVAADTAGTDSTNTQIKVLLRLPKVGPDSAATRWQLHVTTDTLTGTWLWADSATAINGTSDTSAFIVGLSNGRTYYFKADVDYCDTTYTDTLETTVTHTYATPIVSGYTKTIGQTIAAIVDSTSYRNFLIKDTYFGADSGFKLIYMQYRIKGATSWTNAAVAAEWASHGVGRDSTELGSVDSLWALTGGKAWSGPGDLSAGTIYEVRVIATDSTGSDTSNTLEITTSTLPGKPVFATVDTTQGEVSPGIWHFSHKWNKLNDTWNSPIFNVGGYKQFVIESQKFGFDNNHPADSSKTYLMMINHSNDVGYSKLDSALFNGLSGALATAATGVMALPDTASGRKVYTLMASEIRTVAVAANDSVFTNSWNPEMYLLTAVKDSAGNFGASLDTTTTDWIYEDHWIYGRK